MGGLLSHPPPQGQPAPSRRPLGLQRGGPRHLAPAGAGWGPGGGDASPAPSELLSDSEFPGCCQPDSAVLAANRSSGTGGGRAGVRTGGLWGGHPLPRQRDPPLRGLAWGQRASAGPATPGSSPTEGVGEGRRRERVRERLLKFLSGEINIEAISEQVFQLWAWRLSPIPVTGTDSFLVHLCHPPQHS